MRSQFLQTDYPLTSKQEYYTIAARGPMLDKVFSLRYKSYNAENFIGENFSKKFMDEYDSMGNSTSYLLYKDNTVVASIRACIYDPEKELEIPAMECFRDEINDAIGFDDKILEINKFVVDPLFQRKGAHHARFQLFKAMADETNEKDVKHVLMAVRAEHRRFYTRMFDCAQISAEKEYPHLNFKTVLLQVKNTGKAANFILNQANKNTVLKNEPIHHYRAS